MAIFICAQCGHTEETPDEFIGKKARCLSCQTMGTIQPKPPEPQPQIPEPLGKETNTSLPPQDFIETETPVTKTPTTALKTQSLSFVLVILVASILVIQLLSIPLNASTAPQWEYKIVSPKDSVLTDELNELGAQGWEVVTARRASGYNDSFSYEMILKRPK
ncbi:DUF4177 domain-containing protein [Gimesia panareensis]|uniref:DUF4177 domain-containing protein n=1 Tax=Gimesia panareensis TaxID=2527978 RepID=UPI0011884920|nr:DUF4177 domain-containing protein [Gimesia panareensis]QDU47743.1 hypothetical protein Pan110_00530 [Gimesia panareensis]